MEKIIYPIKVLDVIVESYEDLINTIRTCGDMVMAGEGDYHDIIVLDNLIDIRNAINS